MKKLLLFIILCGCSKPEQIVIEPIVPELTVESKLVSVEQKFSTLRNEKLCMETTAWTTSGKIMLLRLTLVYEDASTRDMYVCCSVWTVRSMTDSVKKAQYLLAERQGLEYLQKRTPYHP